MTETEDKGWNIEIPDMGEFLQRFSEIARVRYEEIGLAACVAVTNMKPENAFQMVTRYLNKGGGKLGWCIDPPSAIGRTIAALTDVKTREISNVILLNASCALCVMSDDCKGDPEKNDERDARIMREVLGEMDI